MNDTHASKPASLIDLRGRTRIAASELDPVLDVPADEFPRVVEALAASLDEAGVTVDVEPLPRRFAPPAADGSGRSRSSGSGLAWFLTRASSYPPMSREEEGRLARRLEFLRVRELRAARHARALRAVSGRPESRETAGANGRASLESRRREREGARNQLVERSLWLVAALSRRIRRAGLAPVDLVQEGSLALMRAAERFDWRKGIRFATYASIWIQHALFACASESGNLVRLPHGRRAARTNAGSDGSPSSWPSAPLSFALCPPSGAAPPVAGDHGRILSLDDGGRRDGGDSSRARDQIADPRAGIDFEALDAVTAPERVRRAMETLPARQRLVVVQRFGLDGAPPRSLREVASVLGLSFERVRQIQEDAIRRLAWGVPRRILAPLVA